LPAAAKIVTPAVLDDVVEEEVRLCLGRIVRIEITRDRHVDEVDAVRAGRQQAREDPIGEAAKTGGEDLVARDLHPRRDAVRGEAVERAGNPARDPGAVAFSIVRATVGQAGSFERLLTVLVL